MKTPDDLLKLAKKAPPAVAKVTEPGTYTPLEPAVLELRAKGYSGRRIVALMVEWGGVAKTDQDRTLHGVYRILRRHAKRQSQPQPRTT